MSAVQITCVGKLSKTLRFLEWVKKYSPTAILEKYGRIGVEQLRSYTPVDTGNTANSWYYEITEEGSDIVLSWNNRNINDGCNIAILLQYGHGTKAGTYISGLDYINPALVPIFEEIYRSICEEVSSQ